MSKADRLRSLIDRHLADRSSSPYDSIVDIHLAVSEGNVDQDLESGAEPGSLQDLMQ